MKFERAIAIGTNERLIKKLAIEDGRDDLANDASFVREAANWSYNNFGFGVACYETYLNFLSNKPQRLYRHNNSEWRRIRGVVFERDNYTCQYCGERGGVLEVDHIKPISRGGDNSEENLCTSCKSCNRRKSNKDLEQFLNEV